MTVDLICPECRGDLQMASVRWAVCAQHGGRYEVLFDRGAAAPQNAESFARPAAVAAPLADDAMCAVHPRQSAVTGCPSCGKRLCTLCAFDVGGRSFCSDCAVANANAGAVAAPAPERVFTRRTSTNALGTQCADHPDSEAVTRCRLCGKAICTTCDFALPGGMHLCPGCIEKESAGGEVSPKRKRQSHIALALAIWSTIMMMLMFAGAFNSWFEDPETGKLADLLLTNIVLWPLIIGTGLSLGALDRKLTNTGLMKATAWWNGILGGIFLLIIIAANVGLIG